MKLGRKDKAPSEDDPQAAPQEEQPEVTDAEFEDSSEGSEGEHTKYQDAYSDGKYWAKLKSSVNRLPADMKVLIENALVLYYCAKDRNVPTHVKAVIIGALGYFIVPFDLIPDFLPIPGLLDDLVVLLVAYRYIEEYITTEHRESARVKMDTLFERAQKPKTATR